MDHTRRLSVLLAGSPVGAIASTTRGEIWFEYDANWIASGFPLSPMEPFALRTGAFKASDARVFKGLHGVFNDALPDGWGLLLMDRAMLAKHGWSWQNITPLDRLAYMGTRAMGALEFRPPISDDTPIEQDGGRQALAEGTDEAGRATGYRPR
ncbi:MAG TPA: HipA N-terminal domain-containing protein [Castellaniella sp.]|uniref:HipA N-terminal domain-containing protein n=1 Tax=Castellaniella sp. TaxID=1955812 RepID=UPI002EEBA1B6